MLFDDVLDMDVDQRGTTYVLDNKRPRVVVIDSSGRVVRTMGHKGSGPGELSDPSGIAIAPDGSIWVSDPGNARMIVFNPDGTHKAVYPFRRTINSFPWDGVFLESGDLVDHVGKYRPADDEYGTLIRQRVSATALTTTDSLRLGNVPERLYMSPPPNRGSVLPMTPALYFAIAPQGYVWLANTSEYRIRKVGFDGKELAAARQTVTPISMSRARRQAIVDGFAKSRMNIDIDRLPTKLPIIGELIGTRDGGVWISRNDTAAHAIVTYDRYDAAARAQRAVTVRISLGYPAPIVTRHGYFAIDRSSADLPALVRYRLP